MEELIPNSMIKRKACRYSKVIIIPSFFCCCTILLHAGQAVKYIGWDLVRNKDSNILCCAVIVHT